MIDTLLPLVRGQRLAILGDGKTGKSTLATQLALHQAKTDLVVIYVLIAKRRSDIDTLINLLVTNDALKTAIVVVSTMADSLVSSYLAPYVGCAFGEYLWQKCDQDVLVVYDDLSSHAQAYREISLLANTNPGRDSYPGDIFYRHSSLLERAGKIKANHKSFTALPLVLAPSDDIAAYLPTNIMSITDGQWILDMKTFHEKVRPAVNIGLSVTRVGGRGQNKRQKDQYQAVVQALNLYSEAEQYAHFGSEMALNSRKDLDRGQHIYELFTQKPSETFDLVSQQLMIDIVMGLLPEEMVDITTLKSHVSEAAKQVKTDEDFDKVRDELKKRCLLAKPAAAKTPKSADAAASTTTDQGAAK